MNLKERLKTHHIKQVELRQAVKHDGKPIGAGVMSDIVNFGIYPKTFNRSEIDRQIQDFFVRRGLPPATEQTPKQQTEESNMRRITLTTAILKQFGLNRTPFPLEFDSEKEVYQDTSRPLVGMIVDTARHGGLLALIGDSGAGKTTLLNCAIERITSEQPQIRIVQVQGLLEEQTTNNKPLNAKAITTAIIYSCSTETPRMDVEARARQLRRILETIAKNKGEVLVIIDEAHLLHRQTIKALKRFWELQLGFKRLLRIVLVGQPELKAKLDEITNPDLREFIRRVEMFELQPLNAEQIRAYLASRWQSVGGKLSDTFDDDAFSAIANALQKSNTKGHVYNTAYPQVINNYVSRVMLWFASNGAKLGIKKICAAMIDGNNEILKEE